MEPRQQGTALFAAIVILIGTLVVVQLWLLAAALEAALAREPEALWPAAIASGVLCAANAGLLGYVWRFDVRLRRDRDRTASADRPPPTVRP